MSKIRVTAVILALLLTGCAGPPTPGSQQAVLEALSYQLRFEYHNCVPLGWQPVAVAGTYYPGYIASLQNYEEFLDAIWRGRILVKDLDKPDVRAVFEVLNHLTARGMLIRKETGNTYDYYLTQRALPYYYGSSVYGNNNAHLQYLCYTTIVPNRIVWVQRRHEESSRRAQWYDVMFTWTTGPPESWADDPYLRSHSVVLAPLKNPTLAKMVYHRQEWDVVHIYDRTWGLPFLNAAASGSSS